MQTMDGSAPGRAMERAAALIPTGHASAARLGVQPSPLVVRSAAGCRLTDLGGREMIDFGLANGPLLLGHTPAPVLEAVGAQLRRGLAYGAQHELEAQVAELIVELVPSAEQVLFSTTGSEAVHTALRVARAATGRSLVVRFEGHYHGWLDDIAYGGPGAPPSAVAAALPLQATPLTAGMREPRDVAVLRWNDEAGLRAFLDAHGDEVAAIICEPIPLAGILVPRPSFLGALRELTTRNGAVLVFDEVVTGFRAGRGGAQERLGVLPDLTVLGKALGAGMPVSAVAGSAELLDVVTSGRLSHMGTFNGHPPSLAAARAALEAYRDPGLHHDLAGRTERLAVGLREAAAEAGVDLVVHAVGALAATMFLNPDVPPQDYGDLAAQDRTRAALFARRLLERGVFVPPRGTWMLSTAHTDADVHEAVDVAAGVLGELAR